MPDVSKNANFSKKKKALKVPGWRHCPGPFIESFQGEDTKSSPFAFPSFARSRARTAEIPRTTKGPKGLLLRRPFSPSPAAATETGREAGGEAEGGGGEEGGGEEEDGGHVHGQEGRGRGGRGQQQQRRGGRVDPVRQEEEAAAAAPETEAAAPETEATTFVRRRRHHHLRGGQRRRFYSRLRSRPSSQEGARIPSSGNSGTLTRAFWYTQLHKYIITFQERKKSHYDAVYSGGEKAAAAAAALLAPDDSTADTTTRESPSKLAKAKSELEEEVCK